jgi:ribokinase
MDLPVTGGLPGRIGGPGRAAGRGSFEDLSFVVVGAYVMDCFAETSQLPVWGRECEAHAIRTSPGGKALNQAVALARLGAQVAAVGAVGDDGIGRDVLATLGRERVDVRWVDVRDGAATTICLCFVSDEGDSAIVWHIDDDVAVMPETVRAAAPAFERADAALVTFEPPVSAVAEAIRSARGCGARVFVQPAPRLANPAEAAAVPWGQVDVVMPNEIEARALLKAGHDLPADELGSALAHELGVPVVVVTLGEAGCLVHEEGTSRRYPAQQAVAVDTTGAGDAFAASFAAHLVAGDAVADAVAAAQAAGAWAIGHPGGHESMPRRD